MFSLNLSFFFGNQKLKKIFKKNKFLSKFIISEKLKYEKIKYKIRNSYLTSTINNENMAFVYSFSKLIKIKENSFIQAMNSFRGLSHRFEIFLKRKDVIFINGDEWIILKAIFL